MWINRVNVSIHSPKVLNATVVGTIYPNSVYCGRPSKWGNPFKIGPDGNRKEVLQKYQIWVDTQPALVYDMKNELRGKNLICWCAPKTCHCDVILQLINGTVLDFGE